MKKTILSVLIGGVLFGMVMAYSMRSNVKQMIIDKLSNGTEVRINGVQITELEIQRFQKCVSDGKIMKNNEITETTPAYSINVKTANGESVLYIYWDEYISDSDDLDKVVKVDKMRLAEIIAKRQ